MVGSSSTKPYQMQVSVQEKKPTGKQLFSLMQVQSRGKSKVELLSKGEEVDTDNFNS